MTTPKETTTGEVICDGCGYLHSDTEPCKLKGITVAAHVRAANMSAVGKGLIIGSPDADEYVARWLRRVR